MSAADADGALSLDKLESRLATLTGPENKMRRYRVRQRIKKLQGEDDDALKSTPATVTLPPSPAVTATLPPSPAPADRGRQAETGCPSPSTPRQRRQRSRSPQRGTVPNIGWRAITMDELRAHPSFVALPPSSTVFPLSPHDLRLFRQDSRQWWTCHAGRISTSACASCLGVYEERSASFLGVPPSLRGHGKALDAHSRLSTPLLTESDYALLHDESSREAEDEAEDEADAAHALAGVWRPHRDPMHPSTAHFLLEYTGRDERRRGPRDGGSSVGHIRMAWGSVQEATSILAALNYFGSRNAVVEEAGLQPLEALPRDEIELLPPGLPPIGASPDAIVRWADGSVEPFEVKNHAPFATHRRRRDDPAAPPLEVRDPGPYNEVAVWHVPQLYLHMLCLGSSCRSALFMSASATRGVNIFRLRRDDYLMAAMLRFVARFAVEYGAGREPPTEDYFWEVDGYAELLQGLVSASAQHVELVAKLPHAQVQRGRDEPLFWS